MGEIGGMIGFYRISFNRLIFFERDKSDTRRIVGIRSDDLVRSRASPVIFFILAPDVHFFTRRGVVQKTVMGVLAKEKRSMDCLDDTHKKVAQKNLT